MFKSNVIKKAWEIRKNAAAKFNCPVMEIVWGECLRLARKESKMDFNQIVEIIEKDNERKASVWEKYGKSRIYIKAQKQYGSWMNAGYIEKNADGKLEYFENGPGSRLAYSSLMDLDNAGIHVIR